MPTKPTESRSVAVIITIDPRGLIIVTPEGSAPRVLIPNADGDPTFDAIAEIVADPANPKHTGGSGKFDFGRMVRDVIGALGDAGGESKA